MSVKNAVGRTDTMVEFGRTPRINAKAGRDHCPPSPCRFMIGSRAHAQLMFDRALQNSNTNAGDWRGTNVIVETACTTVVSARRGGHFLSRSYRPCCRTR
jgi:uncharacterized protein (DUF1501 family)